MHGSTLCRSYSPGGEAIPGNRAIPEKRGLQSTAIMTSLDLITA